LLFVVAFAVQKGFSVLQNKLTINPKYIPYITSCVYILSFKPFKLCFLTDRLSLRKNPFVDFCPFWAHFGLKIHKIHKSCDGLRSLDM
jgi:hypothetical protein